MKFISIGLTALVALLHSGFLAMEMFFWTTPFVRDRFGLSAEFAEETAAMAANQGLYNGFLVGGAVVGFISKTAGRENILLALRHRRRRFRRA